MKVLEIGCGEHPWYLRQLHVERRGTPTAISQAITVLLHVPHTYVCLDVHPSVVSENRRKTEVEGGQSLTAGNLLYVAASGEELPFPAETFDITVMSDVLSVPPSPYCGCAQKPRDIVGALCRRCNIHVFPGLSDARKIKMIQETIRVMRPGGFLMVGIYQTSRFTRRALAYMEHTEQRAGRIAVKHLIKRLPLPQYIEEGAAEMVFTKSA